MKQSILAVIFAFFCAQAIAGSFRAIGYNIEGGYKSDASIGVIADNMENIGQSDIWALSEVTIDWKADLLKAAGGENKYTAVSTQGAISTTDTLMLIIDTEKLELLSHKELTHIKIHKYSRPPLTATVKDKESGRIFEVMVNHLERGNEAGRHKQASLLNEYIKSLPHPIVMLGDYNFDWDISSNGESRDKGFDLLLKGDLVHWVKPKNIIKTSCAKKYNSILDFAFVSKAIDRAKSDILMRENIHCWDNDKNPDHRPVELTFEM